MIRTEQEEFYIEPLERGLEVVQEEAAGGGRTHVVYRASAVKKPPVSRGAADLHSRGRLFVRVDVDVEGGAYGGAVCGDCTVYAARVCRVPGRRRAQTDG
uniref:Uncharacterized protein n=1 Tax=Knipowitschia caucasica TaxID=637954 RepID=A0AAV2MIS4_KNICA